MKEFFVKFWGNVKAFAQKVWTGTKSISAKAWAGVKTGSAKVWAWSLANKAIAITVASTVVVGTTCAIVLPIALHNHKFAESWTTDAENHWHSATCKHDDETSDLAAHIYDNACDTTCNVCSAERTVDPHVYDNACDTTCNVCSAERAVDPHVYDNACDTTCNVCDYERTVGAHVYDNACDTDCNECGATRTITHDHADTLTAGETTHWYACSVCGDKKDEAAHVFDKTVASSEYLKAAATATTKAQYYKSCECGAKSTTEYFETDKLPANLQVSDISKTYDGTPVAEPTVTFDGVGAENFAYYKGDEKLTDKPTDAGTYKVVVTVDETDTHAGDRVEKEFTIAKKVLSNVKASVAYDGSTTFGEMTLAHDDIVSGDVIIADIDVTNKNVGVYTGTDAVFAILDVLGHGAANYEIDAQTTEVTVTPKTLNYLIVTKVYNGERGFGENAGIYCQLGVDHGVIAGDTVFLETSDDFEYNVGKYYFVRMNSTDDRDTVWLLGDDAANYEFYGDDVVGEITVTPKTLNYLNLTKVYDGKAGYNDSVFFLDTTHGLVAGDVVSIETNDDVEYNVGTYTLTDVSGQWELDDCIYLEGADAANYAFNYQSNGAVATVTVTPREVWVTGVQFTYNGEDFEYGDYALSTIVFENVVAGETINACDIVFKFDNKDVGSGLIAVGYDAGITGNYEFDISKCSAEIVPKVLNITKSFEYTSYENRQLRLDNGDYSDVISGDELFVDIWFDSANVGANVLTGEDAPCLDGASCDNYVLGTYNFTIIPREIWISAQFYYDGYNTFCDDETVAGATIEGAATEEEEAYMSGFFTFTFDGVDVGSNLTNVTLELEGFSDNYTINVSNCEAEIIPMELTNLNLQITENTFETGSAYLNATNGVVHGDEVYITWTESGHNNTAMWKERGSDLVAPHEGMPFQGQAQVTLEGADASNYTLVTTNNKYGTMTYSEKCKPDVFGYCACGNNHTTGTYKSTDTIATVPVGPAGGTTWEGGIYALDTTEPGYWSIQPNENYCTITVYNPYGNKVTMKGFEFRAMTAGTYYVHITKNSNTYAGDAIIFRYAEEIFDVSSNQSGFYESNVLDGVNGAYYYFKVNKDTNWGASLLIKDGEEQVLDAASYEVKLYDTSFNEITDFIYYDGDIYNPADENQSITGTDFYIRVTLKTDTEFYICVF